MCAHFVDFHRFSLIYINLMDIGAWMPNDRKIELAAPMNTFAGFHAGFLAFEDSHLIVQIFLDRFAFVRFSMMFLDFHGCNHGLHDSTKICS